MKKFICIRGWQRNSKDEIIEEWQYNKLPEEVKSRNFQEYNPQPVVEKKPVKEIPKPIEDVKPAPTRFRPFSVEDVESKED